MTEHLIFQGEIIGGKAEQLVRLSKEGYNVPSFRIIPADAEEDIEVEEEQILSQLDTSYKYFSVRSSATGEDGAEYSFAGQFDTFLFVPKENIVDKIKAVRDSANSERIKSYLAQNKIEGEVRMAVIIQGMINAHSSGVLFGINPISQIGGQMVISAVFGLGEGLVSGELDADTCYLEDGTISSYQIAEKTAQIIHNEEKRKGTILVSLPEEKKNARVLSDVEINQLYQLALDLNEFYQHPQDVEWAIADDRLYVLQSRPITNLNLNKGTRTIWDNSNIVESYPGLTSPLTFSFIREMYRVVYEQFSALLGIDQELLKKNQDVYENMLGLLRGRVYYNLRSWYRALALLPGYKINAEFMETMMGVKERFDLEDQYQGGKNRARIKVAKTILRAIRTFRRLPKDRTKFLAFLDVTVKKYQKIDFENQRPEQLVKHYKTFEKILTEQWNPPLVNDFFAMIYFGIFQKLIKNWIGSENPHLHNDLLAYSNDIISTQPMIQSLLIAKEISEDMEVKEMFIGPPSEVWKNIQGSPIREKIQVYLDTFGERCLGELKLETISYNQAPEKYIKILQAYIKNPQSFDALKSNQSQELRMAARDAVDLKLKKKPFKRMLFNYVLNKTRELVSNRENLRFERTRGFGIVRAIFSAMGKHFEKEDLIEEDRDIFFLTKEEIFDFVGGTAVSLELKKTIEIRKMEYDTYQRDSFVPERIVTYGNVNKNLKFEEPILVEEEGDISGIACCPGIVKSEVCIVKSPDEIEDLQGKIMVTSSTDPGWVSLFPSASGILVERGSLLSHSAIVARELGIPCIVSINGLLKKLKTGDFVFMDGSSGVVKIIDRE